MYRTVENGQSKVFFEEPLQHNPIGTYVPSSGWRFLIFNNLALLDMPGEYVCVDMGLGMVARLIDSQIFRIVCVWPFGLLDYGSATLRCKI